jgi:DNA-binding transcriptional regulator LsrR (DeoR family)
MPEEPDLRRELEHAGIRRQMAREQARESSARIAELIPIALEAGLSKSEIARLAQISRPALDTMLRDQEPGSL